VVCVIVKVTNAALYAEQTALPLDGVSVADIARCGGLTDQGVRRRQKDDRVAIATSDGDPGSGQRGREVPRPGAEPGNAGPSPHRHAGLNQKSMMIWGSDPPLARSLKSLARSVTAISTQYS
jgi:hypothetical protein